VIQDVRESGQLVTPSGALPHLIFDDDCIKLRLSKAPQGTSTVTVSFLDKKGRALGVVERTLVRRPPAPKGRHEVKIDRYSRCILGSSTGSGTHIGHMGLDRAFT